MAEEFSEEVHREGGVVVFTSLMPRPVEVDPRVSPHTEAVQKLMSKVFVMLNDKLWELNRKRGHRTLNLKSLLEKQDQRPGDSSAKYEDREQRVVKLQWFQDNYIAFVQEIRTRMGEKVDRELLRLENQLKTQSEE